MKFYIAKLKYRNGDRTYPWSLFAENFAAAAQMIVTITETDEFEEITIRELPLADASQYGRDAERPDDGVFEHQDYPTD